MPRVREKSTSTLVHCKRTREENQERAYIAASQRSDRGLRARLESARRASEIHQNRTGKALRVTEADVLNDEMYEEINALPAEYRRLNAHLQTPRVDFDRRLLSFLSTQVATREAVRVASGCSTAERTTWDGQMPSPPQQHHDGQAKSISSSPMPPPPTKGAIRYRQAPYPTPRDTGSRLDSQPSPIDTPHLQFWPQANMQQRYMQSPHPKSNETLGLAASKSKSALPNAAPLDTKQATSSYSPQGAPRPDSAIDLGDQHDNFRRHAVGFNHSSPQYQPSRTDELQPLTTTLSWESQQLLATNPSRPNFNFHTPPADMMPASRSNRRYSYNPNWRPNARPNFPDQMRAMVACAPENAGAEQSNHCSGANPLPSPSHAYTIAFQSQHENSAGVGLEETSSKDLFGDVAKQ